MPSKTAHQAGGLAYHAPSTWPSGGYPHLPPVQFPSARNVRYFKPARQTGPVDGPNTARARDVLIVEDEPYLCDLVADVLESDGHSTRKAANGLEALRLVQERPPELILLDLMMPVMDGWEFMAELRANEKWREIPVIIITAVYDVARTQLETETRLT